MQLTCDDFSRFFSAKVACFWSARFLPAALDITVQALASLLQIPQVVAACYVHSFESLAIDDLNCRFDWEAVQRTPFNRLILGSYSADTDRKMPAACVAKCRPRHFACTSPVRAMLTSFVHCGNSGGDVRQPHQTFQSLVLLQLSTMIQRDSFRNRMLSEQSSNRAKIARETPSLSSGRCRGLSSGCRSFLP